MPHHRQTIHRLVLGGAEVKQTAKWMGRLVINTAAAQDDVFLALSQQGYRGSLGTIAKSV